MVIILPHLMTEGCIWAATHMLVDTACSVSEISFECGFNNLSNFNRIFKKKKGCGPSEFRENYRKTRIIV